ncbi:hypothetical protein STAQ_09950 [Allostella sp. ATCC 35155]|nr:hypothetical protein STAQ_09950 [Stella sp. ATCC 35155]
MSRPLRLAYSQPTRIQLAGEIDPMQMSDIRPRLERLANEATGDVLVDLSQTELLDSSGIGALVFLYKRLAARGCRLMLAGVGGQPLDLLRMLRLDRIIPMQADERQEQRPSPVFAAAA